MNHIAEFHYTVFYCYPCVANKFSDSAASLYFRSQTTRLMPQFINSIAHVRRESFWCKPLRPR